MKKIVKVTLIIAILAMGLTFGLFVAKDSQKTISLDFHNSGTPEWFELVEVKGNENNFERTLGFRNSSLPETIEFNRL